MADTGMAGGIADIGTLESSDNLRDASVDPDEAELTDEIDRFASFMETAEWREVRQNVDGQIAELVNELIVLQPHPQNIVQIARVQAQISTLKNFSSMRDEDGQPLDMVSVYVAKLKERRERVRGVLEEQMKAEPGSAAHKVRGAERGGYLAV